MAEGLRKIKEEQKILLQLTNISSTPIYLYFSTASYIPNHNPLTPINTNKSQYSNAIHCIQFGENLMELAYFGVHEPKIPHSGKPMKVLLCQKSMV